MQSHSCCLCSEFSIASTASSSSGSTYEALTQQKPKHGISFKYVHNYCADSGLLGCVLMRHVCLKTKQFRRGIQVHALHSFICSDKSEVSVLGWVTSPKGLFPLGTKAWGKDAPRRSPWHPQGLQEYGRCTRILLRLHIFRLHKGLFYLIVKDNITNENYPCKVFWNARPSFTHRLVIFPHMFFQTSKKDT